MTKINAPGSDGIGSTSCGDFPSLQVNSFSVWLHPETRYRSGLPPALNWMEALTTAPGVELAAGRGFQRFGLTHGHNVEHCQPILQKEAPCPANMALSLVNKLHSYLVQNISAATILPSEFAEKQYAFG